MKPAGERGATDLPADSTDARICSWSAALCTFCGPCTDGDLGGRCPNCGGELLARPRRA